MRLQAGARDLFVGRVDGFGDASLHVIGQFQRPVAVLKRCSTPRFSSSSVTRGLGFNSSMPHLSGAAAGFSFKPNPDRMPRNVLSISTHSDRSMMKWP